MAAAAGAAAAGSSSWIGPAIAGGASVLGGLLSGGGDAAKAPNQISTGFGTSVTDNASTQSIAFQDLFKKLYGDSFAGASDVAKNVPLFQGEAASLFNGGSDFLKSLASGGPGGDYINSRLGPNDPALQAQLEALKSGLGSLFNDELNPAIRSDGVATGTLGGGGNGVAQGVAAGKVSDAYQQGAASLLASSQQQRDALALGANANATTAATAGIAGLPALLGISQAKASAPLLSQSLLQQILGGPTTLTNATGTSVSNQGQSSIQGRGDLSKILPIFQGLVGSQPRAVS
jgi:hypothetical protein